MNIKTYKQRAELIRSTNVYNVYDLKELKNLSLSLTELHPTQNTSGHSHDNADEIYIFIEGQGTIKIGDEVVECKKGDVFTIPRGKFHKVNNLWNRDLIFWSIFEKYGDRK